MRVPRTPGPEAGAALERGSGAQCEPLWLGLREKLLKTALAASTALLGPSSPGQRSGPRQRRLSERTTRLCTRGSTKEGEERLRPHVWHLHFQTLSPETEKLPSPDRQQQSQSTPSRH